MQYDTNVYQRAQVILLSRLDFSLAAPTPSFLLAHMVEVGMGSALYYNVVSSLKLD